MKENDTLRPPLKAIYLVPQSMITITEEGLRLRVGETLSAYKARAELTAKLIGSLTFFVSVLLSFLATSEFRSFLFPSSVWTAFFLFCLVFSLLASVFFAVQFFRTKSLMTLFPESSRIHRTCRQLLKGSSDLKRRRIGW